ncbi:MAG: DUF4352 domain-containing protein [Desulfurococcus sp.]|nr:DUF4352 domain-containing protein [Desulfurococcus sp.]
MKAISPVIATVIIVAVTIAVAIAVALWISGLTGAFTGTENLQIVTAYATAYATTNETYWNITLEVKNVGTTDATIDQIFINGKPYTAYGDNITVSEVTVSTNTMQTNTTTPTMQTNTTTPPLSLPAGSNITILITIKKDAGFTSGQMVEIKLHTASGKEYPKMVTLP